MPTKDSSESLAVFAAALGTIPLDAPSLEERCWAWNRVHALLGTEEAQRLASAARAGVLSFEDHQRALMDFVGPLPSPFLETAIDDEIRKRLEFSRGVTSLAAHVRRAAEIRDAALETPAGGALEAEFLEGDLPEDEYERRLLELCAGVSPCIEDYRATIAWMVGGRSRFLVFKGERTPEGARSLADLQAGNISREEHSRRCRKLGHQRLQNRSAG